VTHERRRTTLATQITSGEMRQMGLSGLLLYTAVITLRSMPIIGREPMRYPTLSLDMCVRVCGSRDADV
jgi:hypothetical protein